MEATFCNVLITIRTLLLYLALNHGVVDSCMCYDSDITRLMNLCATYGSKVFYNGHCYYEPYMVYSWTASVQHCFKNTVTDINGTISHVIGRIATFNTNQTMYDVLSTTPYQFVASNFWAGVVGVGADINSLTAFHQRDLCTNSSINLFGNFSLTFVGPPDIKNRTCASVMAFTHSFRFQACSLSVPILCELMCTNDNFPCGDCSLNNGLTNSQCLTTSASTESLQVPPALSTVCDNCATLCSMNGGQMGSNGNCFLMGSNTLDWFSASTSCNTLGNTFVTRGRLANFYVSGNNFLINSFNVSKQPTWIGLYSTCTFPLDLSDFVWKGSQLMASMEVTSSFMNAFPWSIISAYNASCGFAFNGTITNDNCTSPKSYLCEILCNETTELETVLNKTCYTTSTSQTSPSTSSSTSSTSTPTSSSTSTTLPSTSSSTSSTSTSTLMTSTSTVSTTTSSLTSTSTTPISTSSTLSTSTSSTHTSTSAIQTLLSTSASSSTSSTTSKPKSTSTTSTALRSTNSLPVSLSSTSLPPSSTSSSNSFTSAIAQTEKEKVTLSVNETVQALSQVLIEAGVDDISILSNPIGLSSAISDIGSFMTSELNDTVKKEIGYSLDDIVTSCTYSGVQCNPEKDFTYIYNNQLGNCYIFNGGRHPNYVATGAGRSHGLRMLVTISQKEYPCSTMTSGLKISIHPNSLEPYPDLNGLGIVPGVASSFAMVYKSFSRSEYRCKNYSTNTNSTFDYSVESCHRACYQKHLIDVCKCGDPRFTLPPDADVCRYNQKPCLDFFQNCQSDSMSEECDCPQPCNEEMYISTYTASSIRLPQLKNSNIGTENYALLEIYYQNLYGKVFIETNAYKLNQWWSDVASISGLSLGSDVISLVELVAIIALCLASCLKQFF